jgi:threonine synthase
MPRLLVAQPVNCSPLAVAFAAGAFSVEPGEWERTIAEGVSIAEPVRAPEVLDAVARCGGDFQTVTEDEIRAATLSLVRMGLYAEPTSAVAAAAVPKLVARGTLDPAQETVLILTGSGLKAAESMRALTP